MNAANKSVTINILKTAGSFAENKDVAKSLRENQILPFLADKDTVITLDFEGVEDTTQSFIHALISEAIRKHGIDVLDRLLFRSCSDDVKNIVRIVTDYMQYDGSNS